jgi:hypothetical protein
MHADQPARERGSNSVPSLSDDLMQVERADFLELQRLAEIGRKFAESAKSWRKVGPVRESIRVLLAQHPDASPKQLWSLLVDDPPPKLEVLEDRFGRRLEYTRGGRTRSCEYRRFASSVSEERRRLEHLQNFGSNSRFTETVKPPFHNQHPNVVWSRSDE